MNQNNLNYYKIYGKKTVVTNDPKLRKIAEQDGHRVVHIGILSETQKEGIRRNGVDIIEYAEQPKRRRKK